MPAKTESDTWILIVSPPKEWLTFGGRCNRSQERLNLAPFMLKEVFSGKPLAALTVHKHLDTSGIMAVDTESWPPFQNTFDIALRPAAYQYPDRVAIF